MFLKEETANGSQLGLAISRLKDFYLETVKILKWF